MTASVPFGARAVLGVSDMVGTPREGGGTRREGGGTRHEASGGGSVVGFGLPAELAAEWVVAGPVGRPGNEAFVAAVDPVAGGARRVVKVYYHPQAVPDEQAVALLAGEGLDAAEREVLRAHVVGIVARGRAGGLWFEVMEFCELGSLASLMQSGADLGVVDVVREIASALEFVHGLGLSQGKRLVHQDLKPENVLVRRRQPLDLVLADFGLVRVLDAALTARMTTSARGSLAYSPPEFGSLASPAWDWWSLGMIIAELAAGRHPFVDATGVMMSEAQIITALRDDPIDLSAVTDPRVNLLCRGLLTKDRHHRWGAEQVGAWLADQNPPVIADRVSSSRPRAVRVLFCGTDYDDTAELALALQANWPQAVASLYQQPDRTLLEELERLLRAEALDEAVGLLRAGSPAEIPRQFAKLLAEMNPTLPPVFNGIDLTADGLLALAGEIITKAGEHPAAVILDEVRGNDVLTLWRHLPGMQQAPEIGRYWAAAISGYVELTKPAHAYTSQPAPKACAEAWLLMCTLNHDESLTALNQLITADPAGVHDADQQTWWHDLHHADPPTPAHTVAAYLTQGIATQQTHKQAAQAKADEQQRLIEAEAAKRAQQERAERDRREAANRQVRIELDRLRQSRYDKKGYLWFLAVPGIYPGLCLVIGGIFGINQSPDHYTDHQLLVIGLEIDIPTAIVIAIFAFVRRGQRARINKLEASLYPIA